ncbi:MAG: hypothetical protein UV82_C0013G0021 [Candidatus Magasanikbacteria bacterium GW2011_GWD2_43_18]|jgi:hypothetical protein|nr:MAG: hypothetical protein UV18_C0002G0126 [Candidatus Magasanikbacteria bacterium GW2011_GWC2_42_27]KKT03937.1 MAG: hypothetical protein UV82_C0013G0021 [Candidatus Magasanikbacteria bacterium GW2011_GWD2_43_18]KKT25580.1 MAG: hypothetical protein UW10_C0006G0046 [Candidatus Magasanikbacteria bacterium GW2011_GWA2_43_9]HBB37758.1 hypothetical protein [Candidatus Magasanikbacteria bacterium]HCC13359.1 hypothetical protein [Candidatus Magasanikbacteria bacterium]
MKLKPETLEKLRAILKKDFGQEVNDQDLHDIAFNLVSYYDALSRFYWEDITSGRKLIEPYDTVPERQTT